MPDTCLPPSVGARPTPATSESAYLARKDISPPHSLGLASRKAFAYSYIAAMGKHKRKHDEPSDDDPGAN